MRWRSIIARLILGEMMNFYREDLIGSSYKLPMDGYSEMSVLSRSDEFFDNRIWGIDEVCSFTTYAKGTIYNLVSRGEIPHRRRGKRKD